MKEPLTLGRNRRIKELPVMLAALTTLIVLFPLTWEACGCLQANVVPWHQVKRQLTLQCDDDRVVREIHESRTRRSNAQNIDSKISVKYKSDYSPDWTYTQYEFQYHGVTVGFVDTVFVANKISAIAVMLDNRKLNCHRIPFDSIPLDSMQMQIDYSESSYYTFKTHPFWLVVVSKPMNWVGLMSKNSFYQVIDFQSWTLCEFIAYAK